MLSRLLSRIVRLAWGQTKMAKLRTYIVSFNPAEKTASGFRTTISLLTRGEQHEVQACDLTGLESEVRKLARAFGQSCTPYIRLKDKKERSPNGFDKWAYGREMRFIEFVPETTTNAAG